ncbi:hypothetical protein [uncultured Kordia sp.]|uniref:hypothetical protein n=1 Tax=uncultured Kordia sp. TaxID=507699 RepID=UPI0026083CDD|nr:hypothetical protein [uncultured Kordia sp.]
MLDFFSHTTRICIYLSVLFIALSSCEKSKSEELKLLDSFIETNYAFNKIVLNKQKAAYFKQQKEFPEINMELPNNLESSYKTLISKIDDALTSKESNIDSLALEYNQFLVTVKNLLAKYYYKKLEQYTTTANNLSFSNEYRLKSMKNCLILSMRYIYESFQGNLVPGFGCGFRRVRINADVNQQESLAKITLISNYIIPIKGEENIKINKIVLNNVDQKMKYNISEIHDFTDILLDSLKSGNYQIEGSVQFFDRNGKIDIPFRETFEIN